MYTFLQKSLEPSYFASLATAANKELYLINGTGAGVLFLKVIIMDVHHDLRGKASTIRQRLMALPQYIIEVKYDIKAFNDHVASQLAQLDARGEQSTDLIEYLCQAYETVPDTKFTKYLETKRDLYDEGTRTFTPKEVMKLALDKAELMKDKGEWLKATPEGEKIIALMAKLETLEKSNLQLENRLKKGKGPDKDNKGPGKRRNKSGKGSGDKPQADKADRKMPAWKTKKTKDVVTRMDEKTKKTTTYYWCPKHGYYTVHKPSECKLEADSKPTAQANAAVVQSAVRTALEALQADE
jgi:hypothetical protein